MTRMLGQKKRDATLADETFFSVFKYDVTNKQWVTGVLDNVVSDKNFSDADVKKQFEALLNARADNGDFYTKERNGDPAYGLKLESISKEFPVAKGDLYLTENGKRVAVVRRGFDGTEQTPGIPVVQIIGTKDAKDTDPQGIYFVFDVAAKKFTAQVVGKDGKAQAVIKE